MPGSVPDARQLEEPSKLPIGLDEKERAKQLTTSSNEPAKRRQIDKQHDTATGVSAASARAAAAPVVRGALAFYFRAPAKAFISPRLDYMRFVRAINPRVQVNEAWSLHLTTPGLLAYAVREHGWSFIPKQVLAPLIANVGVGTILYTSYLQTLGALEGGSASYQKTARVYPPPPATHTATAGFVAGAIQSVVAAPLDALQIRFNSNLLLEGHYKDMWRYGYNKLGAIGMRGVAAGLGLSIAKDSLGFAAFFSTFEYVKSQAFYAFVTRYYGNLQNRVGNMRRGPEGDNGVPTIKPHFAVEPAFLVLAGFTATVAHQFVQHPLGCLQVAHYERLESLDLQAKMKPSARVMMGNYRAAYRETLRQCSIVARRGGGWRRWLYRGFFVNTLRQVPSTSAGLVVFELVRRVYADGSEIVRIEKDGYDILLT